MSPPKKKPLLFDIVFSNVGHVVNSSGMWKQAPGIIVGRRISIFQQESIEKQFSSCGHGIKRSSFVISRSERSIHPPRRDTQVYLETAESKGKVHQSSKDEPCMCQASLG
jgi:hypothetical protein